MALLLLVACTDPLPPDTDGTDPQLPPRSAEAATAWLEAGHYLGWHCEDEPHPARPPGAHGDNRICSNDLLSASTSGEFPVGAASVKELWRSGVVVGHAVARKVRSGDGGDSWYWYEKIGTNLIADEVGRGGCVGCHEDAPRDHVFTRID